MFLFFVLSPGWHTCWGTYSNESLDYVLALQFAVDSTRHYAIYNLIQFSEILFIWSQRERAIQSKSCILEYTAIAIFCNNPYYSQSTTFNVPPIAARFLKFDDFSHSSRYTTRRSSRPKFLLLNTTAIRSKNTRVPFYRNLIIPKPK